MRSDFCDAHYSFECGCEPPAPAPLPAAVWVVVELYTKAVQVAKGPQTEAISGKAAIFARPEITQQLAGRIVGVYRDKPDIVRNEGSEYLVERVEIMGGAFQGFRFAEPSRQVDPERSGVCITCRAPSATTFCKSCERERFAEMRARDGDIITERVPAGA